jgi:hypothetical protein
LCIKPEPIFHTGVASSGDWSPEWIIIGAGGYFGLEIDSSTRNFIDGLIGDGNQDVSEMVCEFKGFETQCPSRCANPAPSGRICSTHIERILTIIYTNARRSIDAVLLGHIHELDAGIGIFNVTTHFVSLCITKIVISGDDSATAFGRYFLPQAVSGGVIPKFQISFGTGTGSGNFLHFPVDSPLNAGNFFLYIAY